MILVIKKKTILILLLIAVILSLVIGTSISYASAILPTKNYVVVLDAGHGGRDNGVTGIKSGVPEKELNLIIAKKVKANLEKANIKVVLTRKNDNGLYGDVKSNFKSADLKKRKEIINEAQPNVVVSIHTNKYPADSSRRGAQAFYEQMSPKSKELAKALQASLNILNKEYVSRDFSELKGEYYILKCSKYTSAIVECGFMSNPEEDMLLQTKEYQTRLAYKISSGILGYLSLNTDYNSFNMLDFND